MKEQKKIAATQGAKAKQSSNNTSIESVVRIECDPLGMYTGVPSDPYSKPVQDADDL